MGCMKLQKFYFTFGRDPLYPYQGGWVEVIAENMQQAKAIFMGLYPNRPDSGCLNCAFVYTEERFSKTRMVNGNMGAGCHAVHFLMTEKAKA